MTVLRRNYKLAKKEILTLWEAELPSRLPFPTSGRGNYYVGTQELLRRDVGKRASGENMGEDSKRSKGQKVKSHIWQKWKSESEKVILVNDKREKVNLVNGEFGECTEKI